MDRSICELLEQTSEYIEEIAAREDLIDFLNIETTKFLVKLTPSLNETTAEDVSKYFHLLNDIERIGDHAKIILDESREMKNKGIKFSQDAVDEFRKVYEIIEKLFYLSIKAFNNNTHKGIEDHSAFMEQFKSMEKEYIQNHFERLAKGKTSMELGSYYTSTFAHFNSICAHLGNIIDSFKVEQENIRNNTFNDKKGYVLVINQSGNKNKLDETSTSRKNYSDISLSENNEKMNKSIL